jgi:hypothetical protein
LNIQTHFNEGMLLPGEAKLRVDMEI